MRLAEVATITPSLASLAVLVELSAQHDTAHSLLCSHRRVGGCYTAGLSLRIWERKWKNEVAAETLCGVTQELVVTQTDRKRCGNREL